MCLQVQHTDDGVIVLKDGGNEVDSGVGRVECFGVKSCGSGVKDGCGVETYDGV